MISDDVTAWSAIAFGATVSVAATALLLADDGRPDADRSPAVSVQVVRVSPRVDVVDYAIIRSPVDVEIMVGPEGPGTGWVRPEHEIRVAPLR
ncbi:MAG: hypothetical protein AB7T31_00500 [Gemmatimonadales bacterium]